MSYMIHDLSFHVGTCDGTSMTKINNMMHQETIYKTIQRTKYIVQVVVCKLAAMSEKNSASSTMRVPPQARD